MKYGQTNFFFFKRFKTNAEKNHFRVSKKSLKKYPLIVKWFLPITTEIAFRVNKMFLFLFMSYIFYTICQRRTIVRARDSCF